MLTGRKDGRCNIPALEVGLSYTQVSAGLRHTALLRNDGKAVACGWNPDGRCSLPSPGAGLAFTRVAAGGNFTVLLKSDGTAVACGNNDRGQCNIPALDSGLTYTFVAAGVGHTVLLKSDGTAVACGNNDRQQCRIPALASGLTYTYVAAGSGHTVLLRSDGTAVACGYNFDGQCNIPALDAGLTYTQVAAGLRHTVLLRSDGAALACGWNAWSPCFPSRLADWFSCVLTRSQLSYIPCSSPPTIRPSEVDARAPTVQHQSAVRFRFPSIWSTSSTLSPRAGFRGDKSPVRKSGVAGPVCSPRGVAASPTASPATLSVPVSNMSFGGLPQRLSFGGGSSRLSGGSFASQSQEESPVRRGHNPGPFSSSGSSCEVTSQEGFEFDEGLEIEAEPEAGSMPASQSGRFF